MSRYDKPCKKKLFASLFMSTASIALSACSPSMTLSQIKPSPLVTASCPELTPLSDNTFGATSLKLIEVAGQYYKCRAAATGYERNDDGS